MLALIISGRRTHKRKLRESSDYEDRIEQEEDELEMSKLELRELEEECEDFLSHFLLTRASTMQENVYEIRRKLDQYRHLLEEENARHQEAEGTLDKLADLQLELYTKIQPFASCYGINLYDMGGEYEFLAQLKKDADRYAKYLEGTIDADIKGLKLKAKVQIEGDHLRVSSASRDTLQEVIAFLKDQDYGQPLQYINYR